MRVFSLLAPISAVLLFVACEKSDSTHNNGNHQAAAPTPTAGASPALVTTRSGVEMVSLPGGEFIMGDDRGNPDEAPAHKIKVSPFLMDRFEVTHDLFTKAQLPDPSHWQDNPRTPVERVRWRDAKRYCNERSLLEGLRPCYNEKTPEWDCDYAANGYRLPTEAEWEYAARAGTDAAYDFGAADKLRQFAWFKDNSEEKTHAAGQRKPNGFGIYDL